MKRFLISASLLLLGLGTVHSNTLDEAVARFLAGEKIEAGILDNLTDSRTQKKTYSELKAIYEKNKTPLLAYALVCPAMYVDDMEILPELFAKIAENQPLKARFDEVYAKFWKPRLDPDL